MGVGIALSHPDDLPQLGVSVSMPAAHLDKNEQVRLAAMIREIARPEIRAT
jgi:hypothetical protein